MEVQREQTRPMICVCRLRKGHGHDSCAGRTSGIDEPVCEFCLAAGHHQMPDFDPIVKQAPTTKPGYSIRSDGNGGFIIEATFDA